MLAVSNKMIERAMECWLSIVQIPAPRLAPAPTAIKNSGVMGVSYRVNGREKEPSVRLCRVVSPDGENGKIEPCPGLGAYCLDAFHSKILTRGGPVG